MHPATISTSNGAATEREAVMDDMIQDLEQPVKATPATAMQETHSSDDGHHAT